MAYVTTQDVDKVASLAKLEISPDEKDHFVEQFNKIIGFVHKISELNTDQIEPMTHAVAKKNVLRADEVKDSMPNEEIAEIAPKFSDGSIIVPKIIEY